MRKIYSLVLMAVALLVGTNVWATDAHVSSIADLQAKLLDASFETIYLDADLTYAGEACINILRSVTIDGQGHKINGGGIRTGSTKSTMAINQGAPNNNNWIDSVVLKNITLETSSFNQVLNVRCNLTKLVIDNAVIKSTYASGNNQSITFGGNQNTLVDFKVTNSLISAGNSGYPVITFNPIHLTTSNSTYSGYCALYFKPANSSAGSQNSIVDADACNFDAPNVHSYSGGWNNFGTFVMESVDNITLNLHNCGMNSQELGNANQGIFVPYKNTNTINISGDNSHINGEFVISDGQYAQYWLSKIAGRLTITGGTYATDPSNIGTLSCYTFDENNEIIVDENEQPILEPCVVSCVPDGYEVQEIKQGGVTLYRVVKKAQEKEPGVMYDLNDLVPLEGDSAGKNPVSSFDLSTGDTMKLNQATTTAGYVQVSDNGDDATIIKVGKVQAGDTIDQVLVINNGLDVQGESQVIVQAGSTIQIGEGGINTEKPENIVIEADENGAASLIMDPTITVNQTPNLTVKMKAKQIGWIYLGESTEKYRFWHRFALPISNDNHDITWEKAPNKTTYLFGWNYSTNDWEQYSAVSQMVPFKGYTLTADYQNLGDVEYTFTGQLAGNTNNTLQFERNGFNFFGNSYTGYIDILALVDQIMGESKIDGTVWVWNQTNQSYVAIPLQALRANPDAFDPWMREVAPMQTFILKQNGGVNASTELNYASAIWGNPRYGNNTTPSSAPSRNMTDETTRMRIIVTAENGKSDFVMLTESDRFSDAYEKGYDGEKYMNENALNMYATVNDADYTVVATDNLAGKTLTIQTVGALNYTMSFAKVNGETYAIRDLMTNIVTPMTEGNTYTFAAQPNSTVEGRFVIVPIQNMPTEVETVETTAAAVKGIYTVMGQYVGETADWDNLPAGMYIVNGVKVVK